MKIGIVLPIGPLDRFGYQYNYSLVVENLSNFATRVYICSSSRNRTYVDNLTTQYSNVECISNEQTWFDLDSNGNEVFTIDRAIKQTNLGFERCKQDGIDCGFLIHINQYIQARVMKPLRRKCRNMLKADRPFEWLYKKYQLGDQLFHSDTRVPWILNLQIDNPYVIRPDSLHQKNGRKSYKIEHGEYRSKDHLAIVDCPMEMTIQDLADKMNFIRGYEELNPKFNWKGFDSDKYLQYYVDKFGSKVLSKEPLDATGQIIASHSQRDFISWIILRNYLGPSIRRRLIGFLRGHVLAKLERS